MTIEQVIQWLCWLIVLGVVWYISLKFKRIKQSHNYLKRLDFYVINTKQSIEILQLGRDNYIVFTQGADTINILQQGKLEDLHEISEPNINSKTNLNSELEL